MASEYDALLESPKSEYDALLAQPSQPKSSVLSEIGTAIKNTAVGFVKGLARPPSLAEIALPIFGGQIERQYEHAKAAEQAIRSGQPAAQSIAQAYAPNVSELASPEATRGQKIQAGVNIAAEVAPFLVPALRGIGKYGVAGRSLSDIAFGAKPEPLRSETAAAEQIQKGGEISATQERVVQEGNIPKYPRDDTGRPPAEAGGRGGNAPSPQAEAQAVQVAPAVPQPEQPRIISTAVQTPEGIKTGTTFNQPHDEIVKGALEETKGFMVRDANGQERFVGRTEAADVAKAAGQVKPENAGIREVRKAIDRFDYEEKHSGASDLADDLEKIQNLPKPLSKALREYRDAVEEDRTEWGQRSDLPEQYGDALEKEARKYAGTTELHSQQLAPVSQPTETTPAVTEPTTAAPVTASPVSEAQPPTTAEPLPKTEPPAAPPETPEQLGQALKEPGRTAGVANRVLQERAAKGEIPQAPAAGQGHLTEDIINKSRAEYSPERALVAAQNVRNGSLSEADAGQVRIHEEALTKIAANAEKALDADPKNPALKQAYETSKAALTQWHNDTVQPMKTTWSNAGKSMQGETDIDTGSYIGLQKLAWDTAKRDFTAKEEPVMRLAAKRVSKLTDDVRSAISKAEDQVQKALKPSKYMDLNQLRESLAETLKSITC